MIKKLNKKESFVPKSNENMDIDETDKSILKALLSDGRLSVRQLSQVLKISPSTVSRRLTKLEKKGIIKYYSAILDHEKLGYDIPVAIEVTVSKGRLLEVEREISTHKNVCAVYDITGESDALIIAKFKTRKELNKFVKKLLSMEYVERTNTHLILNVVKEDFRLI